MAINRRRLYKPERKPARAKGVIGRNAPIALPDASRTEIATALFALAQQCGVIVGRGADYDALKDVYTVLGKSRETGRAQDFSIQGQAVADVIVMARLLNGGPMGKPQKTAAAKR